MHGRDKRSRWVLQAVASTCAVGVTLGFACASSTAEPVRAPASAPAQPRSGTELIYDRGLKPGWQDWGWGKHDLANGLARIDLSNFGGWIVHHEPLTARFAALTFRMFAPSSYGSFLQVQLANGNDDKSFPTVVIGADNAQKAIGGWLDVSVPWSALNPSSAPFDRISLHAVTSVGSDWVLFDKLTLLQAGSQSLTAQQAPTTKSAGAGAPTRRSSLAASCKAPGHGISPYIYGIAGDVADVPATARRWGGNPMTRYNFQINAYNTAKDWYFENQKADDYRSFLDGNRAHHAISAITVPMVGWIAKDTTSVGFPVSVYGAQRAHDPSRADVGDGARPDGVALSPKSPTLTSVAAPPELMRKWVEAIHAQDEKTGPRNVKLYFLDNEPNLWSSTHRDVHPDPLTYDELLDRSIKYASAIRAADPKALIAGPSEWGWTGYLYSAKDAAVGIEQRPDRRAHGDVPLIPWYLKKLHDHDASSKDRLLDVLDVHYYPQEKDVYGNAADPATAALRLRSTRSLWDPSYKDESWINDTVRLLPRLKEWVAQNYPGLAISIGEYNFGAEQHISGGLAEAEALGRFAEAGIDYAFYWYSPPKNSPVYWAFRAYRDFDGKGGQFLGRSMETRSSSNVSLFASRDASGKHLVLVALNLDAAAAADVDIELTGCAAIATRRRFSYSASSPSLVDVGAKSGGDLSETLAPYSINVFDITLK
jgi:hypothetical protein